MIAIVIALLAACAGPSATSSSSTSASASSSSEDETTQAASASPASAEDPQPAASTTPTPSGPLPELAIRGTLGRGGEVAIAIENRGATTARIAPELAIEQQDGETWRAISTAGLTIRPDCEHDAPACQELAPGAALAPPDWLGTIGDAQCVCTRCGEAPAGTYRIVARTCDGRAIAGEPFELSR